MKLLTEELGEFDAVTPEQITEALGEDAFGKFAILESSPEAFMQVGNNWQPGVPDAVETGGRDGPGLTENSLRSTVQLVSVMLRYQPTTVSCAG